MTGNWRARRIERRLDVARRGVVARFRSNCSVIFVLPSPLPEVISVIPAMRELPLQRSRYSRCHHLRGLGGLAFTLIVGNSTGTGATGEKNAIPIRPGERQQRGCDRSLDEQVEMLIIAAFLVEVI
jgi:hypothetical protein